MIGITPKSKDFSAWYNEVVLKAELADYAPVKGCMVIRPNGYAIWEAIQQYLDQKFKALGVQNAYFPLFIPESFLKKEKEHVEGFSPQLAVVTIGGGEELKEKLIVRPTSETIMYDMYAKWIKSHRDLPLLLNIWNNVVRWEKRTYLFLRTTEFLWQEGHTAHATFEDADTFAHTILSLYKTFDESVLAIPVVVGKKSQSEKFAGAHTTYTLEALMPDGKALQLGTSHNLGDNFAKAFNIRFQDEKGELKFAWQTSWAETTRVIGALIMVHGDDQGLVLPPKLAPVQVVIVPIKRQQATGSPSTPLRAGKQPASRQGGQGEYVKKIFQELESARIRVKVDDREEYSPGWKFNEWELKGVPIRLEIGEKEIAEDSITVVRRDTGEKFKIQSSEFRIKIEKLLEEIQKNLFERARKFLEENTHTVDSYDDFKQIMKTKRGFIRAFWCKDAGCETKIKAETKASTRVLPLDAKEEKGKCIYCGKEARHLWYFAQAY